VQPLRRPLRILDLIPTATMDGNAIPYVQEGGTFDSAHETVEGAAKPATQVEFIDAEAKAETVAHFTKVKRQTLSDAAALQGVIQSRLTYGVVRRIEAQILAGAGPDATEIQGILTMTGVADVEYAADELAADQALEGIVTVLLSDAVPNAVVLNPRDWADALKAKAEGGDGHYFSAGPFLDTAERLWSAAAIPSAAIPQGKALVGDFTLGATLFVREGVNVLTSDSDQDDFTRNRVTLLGEGRFACALFQPSAFAIVNLEPGS
jgi:HK97 family phage major capsid protein